MFTILLNFACSFFKKLFLTFLKNFTLHFWLFRKLNNLASIRENYLLKYSKL